MSMTPEWILVIYAVLVGASVLIPIPVLDDWAAAYFRRKMVRDLASQYGLSLSEQEVSALAEVDSGGCLDFIGEFMLGGLAKRIIRQFLIVREIQRTANMIVHSYYYGFLLNHVFLEKYCSGKDIPKAHHVHQAILAAKQNANFMAVSQTTQLVLNRCKEPFNLLQAQIILSLRVEFEKQRRRGGEMLRRGLQIIFLPILNRLHIYKFNPSGETDSLNDECIEHSRLLEIPELLILADDLKSILTGAPDEQTSRMIASLEAELNARGLLKTR